MDRITRWGESGDCELSGLVINGIEISEAELTELPHDREGALFAGCTPGLCDDYEAQGGAYAPGDLFAFLERLVPA